jgi:predicted ArsR family transcriptional regulator
MAAERKEQGSTRRSILQMLRRNGEMTALELSEQLQVGAVGVRQHLGLLERDGLVQISGLRRSVGRPANLYSLTNAAQERFPRNYDRLALDLLAQVADQGGPEAVTQLLVGRRIKQFDELAPAFDGKSCRDRIAILAAMLVQQGYMCEWEETADGAYLLTEYNCPLDCVARRCNQLCVQEHLLYTELLAAPVIQEQTIAEGGVCCRYRILSTEA